MSIFISTMVRGVQFVIFSIIKERLCNNERKITKSKLLFGRIGKPSVDLILLFAFHPHLGFGDFSTPEIVKCPFYVTDVEPLK